MQKTTPFLLFIIAITIIFGLWFYKNTLPIVPPVVSSEVKVVKVISDDLKIVSEPTREKYSNDEMYISFSGIINGNDFDTFYKNYQTEKDTVYKIIQEWNGDLFYTHGWTDTFIKLAYSCDIFKENMLNPDNYAMILSKSLKILYLTDENGKNVGIYKDVNDVMDSFIAKTLTLETYLDAYISVMKKTRDTIKKPLWIEYMNVYIELYSMFRESLINKTAPDCEKYLRDTFPIHLKEFEA
jgi:hypothetical protein